MSVQYSSIWRPGEVVSVSQDLLRDAEGPEDEDEDEEDQDVEWKLAKEIALNFPRFRRLPTKYDIHEWDIMRRFADSIGNRKVAEELEEAIHGAGAFRMFKSVIRQRRVEEQWYAFRRDSLEEIARDWCKENGIPWK